MFPHVNLCPLLESHLRGCAETKGLITPDAAHRGGGGVLRGEDRSTPRTWGNGQLLLCWSTFFFSFFPPPPFNISFNISLRETLRLPTGAGAARARGDLPKFSPFRGGFCCRRDGAGASFVGRDGRWERSGGTGAPPGRSRDGAAGRRPAAALCRDPSGRPSVGTRPGGAAPTSAGASCLLKLKHVGSECLISEAVPVFPAPGVSEC